MNVFRIRVGLVVGLLGLALTTGTAAAQLCTASDCANTTTTVGEELGVGGELPVSSPGGAESDVLGERETAGAAAAAAPEGALPFTGGDVVGLVLIGAAALGAGTFLLRRSKTTA